MEKNTIKNLVNKILFEDYSAATEILSNILEEKQHQRERIADRLIKESEDVEDVEEIELPEDPDMLGIDEIEDEEQEEKAVCFTTSNKDIIDLFNSGFIKMTITKIGLDDTEETIDFDFSELENVSVMDIDDADAEEDEDDVEDDSEDDVDLEEEGAIVKEADEDSEPEENNEDEGEETQTDGEGLVEPTADDDAPADDAPADDDVQDLDPDHIDNDAPVADDPIQNNGNGPDNQADLDQLANNIAQTGVKESIGLLEIQKENLAKITTDIANMKPQINDLRPEGIATTELSRPFVAATVMVDEIEQAKNELTVYIQNKIDYLNANAEGTAEKVSDEELSKLDAKIAYLSEQLEMVKTNYLGGNEDELDNIGANIEDETGTDADVDDSETSGEEEGESDSSEDNEKPEGEEGEEETSDDAGAEGGEEDNSGESEETEGESEEENK